MKTPALVTSLVLALMTSSALAQDAAVAPPPAADPAPAPATASATPSATPSGIPAPGTKLSSQQKAQLMRLFESDSELREQIYAAAKNQILDVDRARVAGEEKDFFNSQKRFVIIAYGIMWALVVVFVVFLYLRQKRLEVELADAEKRIPKAS